MFYYICGRALLYKVFFFACFVFIVFIKLIGIRALSALLFNFCFYFLNTNSFLSLDKECFLKGEVWVCGLIRVYALESLNELISIS